MNKAKHVLYSFLRAGIEGVDSLVELALDMRWSWNHAADELWRRLDPALWDLTHNPPTIPGWSLERKWACLRFGLSVPLEVDVIHWQK